MTKLSRLMALLLLIASSCSIASGQGATILFPALQGPNGASVPFAKLTFCTTPATFDFLGNCTNTVTVFQDSGLSIPYSSAITTDGLGNFPPNVKTTTALWFSPAANYCYTATGGNLVNQVSTCTPFSVPVTNGSSPTFAGLTVTAPGIATSSVNASGTVVGSNIPASIPSTGSCTNQFVTALNTLAAPTCTTDVLASAQHANQGTTTTVLHGNAAGNPAFGSVAPGDTTGTTGSGSVFALQTSPAFTTPNIGAATGTSLNASGTVTASQTLANGSQSSPGHSYGSETSSGWFWQQAGIQGLSRLGAYIAQVNSTQFSFANGYSLCFSSGAPNSVACDAGTSRGGVGITDFGNGSAGDTTGTVRFARMWGLRIADGFGGADCGAKINAASTALAGPGEIWVSPTCGTTWSTAWSLSTGQFVRIVQGGTYTYSALLNLPQSGGVIGPGCGGNLCSVILQAANSSNLTAGIVAGNQSVIQGLELDGNKANNPTQGVGINLTQKQHVRITNVLVQNFKAHGRPG